MSELTPQSATGNASNGQISNILISGASFAGLAAAWWMNQLGYAVTVVEVAKGVRRGGTPVNIRDGAFAAFAPSTSKRSFSLEYSVSSPRSWKAALTQRSSGSNRSPF